MPLTPFHFAFAWMIKLGFKRLSFAALTIGAVAPDIEPLVAGVGWSIFCGWGMQCLSPDRLVLHSIVGALTVDVALTILFVKTLELLKIGRLGIHGFTGVRIDAGFYVSAAIGAISHVLVDWLHHPANPIFWPFPINGSYYVGGLLLGFLDVFSASTLVTAAAAAIMIATVIRALGRSGYSFWIIFSNPPKALAVVTENLSKS